MSELCPKPVGIRVDKEMKHSKDTLLDDISEDIAVLEKRTSPTANQKKSTRYQENMETGDCSLTSEEVPGPEEHHKSHPLQHHGDSILGTDYADDMLGAKRRSSPKLSKQKSTSNQENEEYGPSRKKNEFRSRSKGIGVHQQMQHSEEFLATSELSDYTDEDVRMPSTNVKSKQKLNRHQKNKQYGDCIQRRDRYSPAEPSKRILQLATPKEDKREWATSFTKIVWGNQDPIWPHSFSALSTTQSKRILSLSKPKKVFEPQSQRLSFQCGWRRASEKVSFMDLPSDRILKLAEPKKRLETAPEQRPNAAVLMYKASNRILQLACARPVHSDYRADREVPVRSKSSFVGTTTPQGAHRLSNPKLRKASLCFPVERPEVPIRPISKMARSAVATPRLAELAKPKHFSTESLAGRSEIWYVSRSTSRAIATPRTLELAQPIKRAPMNAVQYNPEAFIVKEAAKKALCSPRIETLAKPISRQ